MIRKHIDRGRNVTVQRCSGKIKTQEIREAIVAVYADRPTLHQLWDMTDADVEAVETDSLREFAKLVSEHGHGRQGGKTAIVSPVDLAFGLSRMYGAMASITGQKIEVRVFRSREEADAWLDEG